MADSTRLILHMGMGKTGSSALQVAFVRNRDRLTEIGVAYPESRSDDLAREGGVTGGNATFLAPLFGSAVIESPPPLAEAVVELNSFCESLVGLTHPICLYSCEELHSFEVPRFDAFVAAAASAGISLELVVYLRNLAPYFMSTYSQRVKVRRYTGSFSAFISDLQMVKSTHFKPRLSHLLQTVGRDRLTVLHYDTDRDELFQGFVRRVLGHEPDATWELPPAGVNRALTRHEIALMRHLNHRLTSRRQGDLLSRALVEFGSGGDTPIGITEAEIALLEERFDDDVAWINREFFGESRLSIRDGAQIVDADSPDDHIAPEEERLLDCLARVFVPTDEDRTRQRATIDKRDQQLERLRTDLGACTRQRAALTGSNKDLTRTNKDLEGRLRALRQQRNRTVSHRLARAARALHRRLDSLRPANRPH